MEGHDELGGTEDEEENDIPAAGGSGYLCGIEKEKKSREARVLGLFIVHFVRESW